MTVQRGFRRPPVAAHCLLAALICASLVGCGMGVPGHPVVAPAVGHVTAPLPDLLPRPEQFPPQYTTVVLGPDQAREASDDLTGMPAGSLVEPAECAASAAAAGATATVVGANDAQRVTITVELLRTDEPMTALRDHLRRCAVVRAHHGAMATTVVTEWDPLGTTGADEALAVRRTVAGPGSATGYTQTMQVRVGQVADVRISATYLTFTAAPTDSAGLERVFAATVANVRRA